VRFARCVGVFLNGDTAPASVTRNDRMLEGSFFLILNAFWEQLDFVVPDGRFANEWVPVLDTAREFDPFFDLESAKWLGAGDHVTVEGRSAVLLSNKIPAMGRPADPVLRTADSSP
jgi:isoamylase